ncbi:MAG: AMP-binding protein, partial [Pseudohongiellaceae bacterium]
MTSMPTLLHDPILIRANHSPDAPALGYRGEYQNYARLADAVQRSAAGLLHAGLLRQERVAVYLDKRLETIHALFGTSLAGGVFVPVNPLLKAEQVAYILQDCNVRILVTSPERLVALQASLAQCPDLHTVLVVGQSEAADNTGHCQQVGWNELQSTGESSAHRTID